MSCIGIPDLEEDDKPLEGTMECLTGELFEQIAERAHLEGIIKENLKELGYDT